MVGRGVRIPFFGDADIGYVVSAPERIVHRMAIAVLGEDTQDEEELQDVLQEFANVVAGNVVARLAQLGRRIDIGPPDALYGPMPLDGKRGLFMAIATPEGDLVVALAH